ncbi:hypothetical protein WGM54_14415 [Paenibacillus polymyxa]|uniref:hypothetical protein n=1 Tax=Paenibacillus polymyxa TaxID=1406 RepID=UPI00307E8D00
MEQIQSHEVKDIWRIREGLLVEIHKYKSLGYHIHSKKEEKRVKGCKGLTELTKEYTDSYYQKTFPKGTLFYHGSPVEPVTDPQQFKLRLNRVVVQFGGQSMKLMWYLKTSIHWSANTNEN